VSVLPAVLALTLAVAATAPRAVVRSGDEVAGFGRIGHGGIVVLALDDAGRGLFTRDTYEQAGLYWADGDRILPAFNAQAFPGMEVQGFDIAASPNGNIAFVLRDPLRPTWAPPLGIGAVVDGQPALVAALGGSPVEGDTYCWLSQPAVNDRGQVAFRANVGSGASGCTPADMQVEAIYRVDDGQSRRIVTRRELPPTSNGNPTINLLGLADDGTLIVAQGLYSDDRILAVDLGRRRTLANRVTPLATNAAGELLYAVNRDGTFAVERTERGARVTVLAAGDPAPWGEPYDRVDIDTSLPARAGFNRRGDVLLRERSRGVLHPAGGGAPTVLVNVAAGLGLNEAGAAAVVAVRSDTSTVELLRYAGGPARRLARTGDVLADGTVLASGGLDARCLAADGRVAVVADAHTAAVGLLCADSSGTVPLARRGDPTSAGRRFYEFSRCLFGRPGEVVFLAQRLVSEPPVSGSDVTSYAVEDAVYRAAASVPLERLIGPGDTLADGSLIVATARDGGPLATDSEGRVLVQAFIGEPGSFGYPVLLLRTADGMLQRAPLSLSGSSGRRGVGFETDELIDHRWLAGITDTPRPPYAATQERAVSRAAATRVDPGDLGATALLAAGLSDGGPAVLLIGEEVRAFPDDYVRLRLLHWSEAGLEEPFALGIEHRQGLDVNASMHVAGDRVVVAIRVFGDRDTRVLSYRLGDVTPRVASAPQRPGRAATCSGRSCSASTAAVASISRRTHATASRRWSPGATACSARRASTATRPGRWRRATAAYCLTT